jgi:hypothetical protein
MRQHTRGPPENVLLFSGINSIIFANNLAICLASVRSQSYRQRKEKICLSCYQN